MYNFKSILYIKYNFCLFQFFLVLRKKLKDHTFLTKYLSQVFYTIEKEIIFFTKFIKMLTIGAFEMVSKIIVINVKTLGNWIGNTNIKISIKSMKICIFHILIKQKLLPAMFDLDQNYILIHDLLIERLYVYYLLVCIDFQFF